MGTLLSRRRYMGSNKGIDENSYIQDGLVFQLDGIADGGVSGHWIDLKQNGDFVLAETISKNDYGFVFPTSDASGRAILSGSLTIPSHSTATVQICFRDNVNTGTRNTAECAIFNTMVNSSGPFLRYYYNKGEDWIKISTSKNSAYSRAVYPSMNQDKTMIDSTISIAPGIGYLNGQEVTLASLSGGYGSGSNIYIGGLTNQRICYCAIRMYNRILTASEIVHNQKIDNIRFNLGLTI